jgi:cytosine/creatinine deaminase
MGFDLLVKNATLPDGGRQDIGVVGERIVAAGPNLAADAGRTVDAAAYLASPPFVDAHFHMDATLSLGQPRLNESGTLPQDGYYRSATAARTLRVFRDEAFRTWRVATAA